MNNIFRLIVPLAFFSLGCTPNVNEGNKIIQKLDMYSVSNNAFVKGSF